MAYPEYVQVEQPLLKLLFEQGGSEFQMRAKDTYEPLADYFGLTSIERTQSRNDVHGDGRYEPYWNNMVQWARRRLKERGYLAEAPRGFWKLSKLGIAKAQGLSTGNFSHVVYPDDVPETSIEGAKQRVPVNRFERSAAARSACIEKYGYQCSVCDMDFESIYGERGRYFIHVHHIIPLAKIGDEYVVDPITDLRPVCPNCHAMLHRTDPPCTIEELKQIMRNI